MKTFKEMTEDKAPDLLVLRARPFDTKKFKKEDLEQYGECFDVFKATMLANLALEIFNNMSEVGDI